MNELNDIMGMIATEAAESEPRVIGKCINCGKLLFDGISLDNNVCNEACEKQVADFINNIGG